MGDISGVWVFKNTAELVSAGAKGEVQGSAELGVQYTGSLSGHGRVPIQLVSGFNNKICFWF